MMDDLECSDFFSSSMEALTACATPRYVGRITTFLDQKYAERFSPERPFDELNPYDRRFLNLRKRVTRGRNFDYSSVPATIHNYQLIQPDWSAATREDREWATGIKDPEPAPAAAALPAEEPSRWWIWLWLLALLLALPAAKLVRSGKGMAE